jgi:hypothetical protein
MGVKVLPVASLSGGNVCSTVTSTRGGHAIMVAAIPFPSPVMRIDPETHAVIVARRDPETGAITLQTPGEGTLQRDKEARAAAAAAVAVPTTPVVANPAAVKPAAPTPPVPVPVITPAATAAPDAAGHLSVFV